MKSSNFIDISPVISERLGVFPGDTKFRRQKLLDFEQGHNLRLSAVTTTLHLGAHADSVGHYHKDGEGVDQRKVDDFIGDCQVIEVKDGRGRIQPEEWQHIPITAPRVLFKTESFPDPENWNSDFRSFAPASLEKLASVGVRLVGIDTPSVDPEDSKALESHQVLYRSKMSVLEGLVLRVVKPGLYTLIAAPLRIEGADASPVRALLFDKIGLF